jgi:site-specific recombinase XerD
MQVRTATRPTQPTRPTKASAARSRRVRTVASLVGEYLIVHQSEGHSPKTVEWHTTALSLLVRFLEDQGVTDPHEVETSHLREWVVWLGTTASVNRRPGRTTVAPRSKRTIQTYTRSAHAFGKWLYDEGHTAIDITDRFTLPKAGKPLIRILEDDEFQRLLAACEAGQHPREYAYRDRAMLWLLYDTGIRLSELATLTCPQLDMRGGVLVVHGKGDKERRIAIGANALAAIRRYLDHARWAFRDSGHSEHVFLGEKGILTYRGVEQVIRRLKKRCGFTDRRVSAHIFRHTFAVRYLMLGGDPFTLQELLGHEDMETIRNYMHLNDIHIQTQKRKFSPGDHVSFASRATRRRDFRAK